MGAAPEWPPYFGNGAGVQLVQHKDARVLVWAPRGTVHRLDRATCGALQLAVCTKLIGCGTP